MTGDDDDDDDDGNNGDNNKATTMLGDNKDDNSEGGNLVSSNDNTNSTTNPINKDPPWMSLLALADDNGKGDPDDYNEFHSDYDLNGNTVFDNDDAGNEKRYVCMTVTDTWLPLEEDEYKDDDILLRPNVFGVSDKPSIYPNFLNGTLNDSFGCPYINDDPISNTQILFHALLKSSMRKKRDDVDNSIKHYDALCCKFQ